MNALQPQITHPNPPNPPNPAPPEPASRQPLALSVVTSARPRTLAKSFELDASGSLVKKSVADMLAGGIERRELPDLQAFAQLLDGLNGAQALVYGLPHARGQALSQSPVGSRGPES